MVRAHALAPVVACEDQLATVPSKLSLQSAPTTVKAFASVNVSLSGLVTFTLHAPAAAPARLNWLRRLVELLNVVLVAVISVWPLRMSFTTAPVLKLTPVISMVTAPGSADVGVMLVIVSGGGGGVWFALPLMSKE